MKSTIPVRCSTVLLITYLLAACTPSPSTAIAGNRSPDFYLKTNSIHHKVTIKVLAGEKNTMNFNGYNDGHMVITIPMNWRITIDFVNTDNAQAHSAMIVPLADHTMMDIPMCSAKLNCDKEPIQHGIPEIGQDAQSCACAHPRFVFLPGNISAPVPRIFNGPMEFPATLRVAFFL